MMGLASDEPTESVVNPDVNRRSAMHLGSSADTQRGRAGLTGAAPLRYHCT